MQPLSSQRVAILGLGLIGSSLARALAEHNPNIHIAAFDISPQTIAFASQQKFIHSQHAHAGQAAGNADIIVIAAPPATAATLAADIAPFLKQGAIVTDVLSVKRDAINAITPHLPHYAQYVPAHPIAGSEHTGVEAGRANLFAGKRVILTPEESDLRSESVARIKLLWESVGARVEYMPADLHDRIYAYVSHLPQLVAYAARQPLQELPISSDESYIRFTRLMKSDPALWADIGLANADYISAALEDFAAFASQMQGELAETPAAGGMDPNVATQLFPRVIATCLIATASLLQETTGVHPARYAGSGFADMTSPAISDPEEALAAISSHHWVIAKMLQEMLVKLDSIRNAVASHDKAKLIAALV